MSNASTQPQQTDFDYVHSGGDGRTNLPEYTRLMQALGLAASDEELAIGFQTIDTTGSGQVECNEFSDLFASR
jgi:Ca2+-binding EF-hand superfamily protein